MKSLCLWALGASFVFGACNTQRVPPPMGRPEGLMPAGQGADYIPGPQEVVVLRHGDPVSVRRPGAVAGFPLSFYQKRMRVGSGESAPSKTEPPTRAMRSPGANSMRA